MRRVSAGAAATKRTAVIHLHGGGFARGSKEGARTARPLATLGYTWVASQYRLASEAVWPAQIEDVKAAIRWTRAHAADLDIDPARLVVLGYSAGGRLALIAAGTPDRPDLEGQGGNAGVLPRAQPSAVRPRWMGMATATPSPLAAPAVSPSCPASTAVRLTRRSSPADELARTVAHLGTLTNRVVPGNPLPPLR